MKTTIEIHGYEIVIEESNGLVTVSALKDGETVEEFELESEEGEGGFEGEEENDFEGEEENDFEEEENDFEGEPVDGDDEDLEDEPVDEDEDLEDEPIDDESAKLESFNSFIRKRK